MTSIVVRVTVTNTVEPAHQIDFISIVAREVGWLTLPNAWRDRLGKPATVRIEPRGEVCGPVTIQIDGFRPIITEVIFTELESRDGQYHPLLGHLALAQSSATVDQARQRLVAVPHVDAKRLRAA